MTVLSDNSLLALCSTETPMISPFHTESVKVCEAGERIASYGLSSAGYDLRAAPEFKLFIPPKPKSLWQRLKELITGNVEYNDVLDYKNITEDMFETVIANKIVVPPGAFLLARSVERVEMPRNVLALCIGKSTIARAGWNCLCTPIEPLFSGYITFEFQNTTNRPNTFYANEGVLQLVFLDLDKPCKVGYSDRNGKYNNQGPQIILPKV